MEPAGFRDRRGPEHDSRGGLTCCSASVLSFGCSPVSRRDFEDAMNEELRFHIEQYADDLRRSGVPREEALRRARMEFGALTTCRKTAGRRAAFPVR